MREIKYIIQLSDIHIRKMLRHNEYREVFNTLYNKLNKTINDSNRDQFVIVITGDILHQKIEISNEMVEFTKEFLTNLSKIADVVFIAGNHDLLVNNKQRMDSLTPIHNALHHIDNIFYLKESVCYKFHNIVFANYSVFEDNRRPEIESFKEEHPQPQYTYVGLYHAPLQGAKTELGFSGFDHSDNVMIFTGLDMVLCGDIHLHQTIPFEIPVVYAGSLIQQSFGENLSGHGFLVWNVQKRTYRLIEIPNEHTMVKIKIGSINTFLEEDKYEITNK